MRPLPRLHPISLHALIAACTLLLHGSAHAVTLFFDLNNAETEVRAVARALGKGSPILVLPSLDAFGQAQREHVLRLRAVHDDVLKHGLDCREQGRCHAVWAHVRELEVKRHLALASYRGAELAREYLEAVSRAGAPIERVVISGHHSKGYFRGELLELDLCLLDRLKALDPRGFDAAQAVYLLGCETGTVEMLEQHFRRLYPNARLIVGAEDRAPTRFEPRNIAFVEAFARRERRLARLTGPHAMARAYAKLLQHAWPVSVLWHGQWYFSREHPLGLRLEPATPSP